MNCKNNNVYIREDILPTLWGKILTYNMLTDRLILYNCLNFRFKENNIVDIEKNENRDYLYELLPFLYWLKIMNINKNNENWNNKYYWWLWCYPITQDENTKIIK
jgi:hypothetical protein